MKRLLSSILAAAALATLPGWPAATRAQTPLNPLWVPAAQRGRIDAERSGFHDAARVRTVFWNYGMVGDFPAAPQDVDLSVFHSAEAPKGSGMNYTDGITPFVLAKIRQQNGTESYIWETGYRERQGLSPWYNRVMRFEPRPGYFEANPAINKGRSPAVSSDSLTWPDFWPDKQGDTSDPGWRGSWNGYFGKSAAADLESFSVMDDDYFDAWFYYPDSTDAFLTNPDFGKDDSLRRHGLGLRVEVRGFQWANPQAANVIFWHYDIVNESTTDYDDNIVFGLYMDSGVGGSSQGCDPLPESDDDNAYFDKSLGLNLVYTWDSFSHGVDLASNCSKTGYLGYAYLETPGNAFDGVDNDADGMTDELRDSTVVDSSSAIVGQDAIRAAAGRYDLAKFERYYGPLGDRPAYRAGRWFLIDEDMDWVADLHDVGEDGKAGTRDRGEGDGAPTYGEPSVDKTDLDESDQIGLTSFKMNRIRAGLGNPDPVIDNIWFFEDENHWPLRMYEYFTNPNETARFDSALAANYNIGFFFASGPFRLKAGKRERFSLALAYGGDLQELRSTVRTVQQIYNANYLFAVPPPMPTLKAETGDGYVRLAWDDIAERGVDPVTYEYDFEGYRIYRATDYEFRDAQVISTGTGSGPMPGNGRPAAQFDLVDGKLGFSRKTVAGVAYWLGEDSGLRHTWVDTTVTNGQEYFYAVTAYDYGFDPGVDSLAFYPSENAIAVSRTPRRGYNLPPNVVQVRPNPRVQGWERAQADTAVQESGTGTGQVAVEVVASGEVPDGHGYRITFTAPHPDSVRAVSYALTDTTLDPDSLLFKTGADLAGLGVGPVGAGLLPVIATGEFTAVDTAASRFLPGSDSDARFFTFYNNAFLSKNQRRLGYPDDIRITFSDTVQDTGLALGTIQDPTPAKFYVEALTAGGPVRLQFAFKDRNGNGLFDGPASADYRQGEFIDVLCPTEASLDTQITWRVMVDTLGRGLPQRIPGAGDVYRLVLERPLGGADSFVFGTRGERVDPASAAAAFTEQPYVVPNPYVGSASFEPSRYAISGRGLRRMEFRAVPLRGTVRIYTVRGELVRSLYQDESTGGYVPWDLRTKDNLDVAPGLYIFHVESPGGATFIGKFAILK